MNTRIQFTVAAFLIAVWAGAAYGTMNQISIVEFDEHADLSGWRIQNDVVMGGRSESRITQSDAGTAIFSGTVSLENNGGFASVRYSFPQLSIAGHTTAHLRLRGDGKRYIFQVEAGNRARHYYAAAFETTGEWETVVINLRDMEPMWRGSRLNRPNYSAESMAQLRFMIANDIQESFELEIESIWLE